MTSSIQGRAASNVRAKVVLFGISASKSGLADASAPKVFSEQMRWRLWRRATLARMVEGRMAEVSTQPI